MNTNSITIPIKNCNYIVIVRALSALSDMRYVWDTQNRLLAASSNGYVSTFIYDGEGQRTVKQHGGNEAVYTNGTQAALQAEAPHYSLYANPYFVMHDGDKYTEHIYIGSERIAVRVAKLSSESSVLGNFDEEDMAGYGIVSGGLDYGAKREAQEQVIAACYDSLQFAYLLVDRRDLVNIGMVPSDADTSDVDDSDDERGTANPDTEWKKVYYYCTDHLGSSRLVLNSNGIIAERLMFLPTGEVFKDKQISTLYHSDFLFSGKELDAETGNYYFGARYLAPRLGIWLSPDPMQLKYPHVSSYAYCMGNPVRLIDPTGKDVLILYKDSRGNDQLFRFNGTQSKMPKGNQFIKDFIQAYNYLKYTGGGENLRNAVENPKYEIYVNNAELFDKFGTEFYKYDVPTVYWESRKGIQFKDGSQSPATRLEHEFDHAIDYLEHTHDHRQRQGKNDSQYGNAEERRVITGSERRTAKANHEAVRHHHTGTVYETKSPITTEKKTNYE